MKRWIKSIFYKTTTHHAWAVVDHDDGSSYGISFPDIPEVFAAADEHRDIRRCARDALELYFEDGGDVPECLLPSEMPYLSASKYCISFETQSLRQLPRGWWILPLGVLGLAFWALILSAMLSPAEARTIRNDGGGSVARYAGLVEAVRLSGNTLRIGGDYCASACTMYLAVADCVDLDTDFAFHGPRNRPAFGPLSPERFEHWSMLMADHYPEPLRGWFVSTARYEIEGFMMLKGRDLVAMGVANGC